MAELHRVTQSYTEYDRVVQSYARRDTQRYAELRRVTQRYAELRRARQNYAEQCVVTMIISILFFLNAIATVLLSYTPCGYSTTIPFKIEN